MALEQNLSSLANINKDTLVDAAKAALASQKDKFIANLKSSVTENVKRLLKQKLIIKLKKLKYHFQN